MWVELRFAHGPDGIIDADIGAGSEPLQSRSRRRSVQSAPRGASRAPRRERLSVRCGLTHDGVVLVPVCLAPVCFGTGVLWYRRALVPACSISSGSTFVESVHRNVSDALDHHVAELALVDESDDLPSGDTQASRRLGGSQRLSGRWSRPVVELQRAAQDSNLVSMVTATPSRSAAMSASRRLRGRRAAQGPRRARTGPDVALSPRRVVHRQQANQGPGGQPGASEVQYSSGNGGRRVTGWTISPKTAQRTPADAVDERSLSPERWATGSSSAGVTASRRPMLLRCQGGRNPVPS